MPKSPKRPVVVLTGGPTRAYLDRVRFLTNVSSGAVAFELAKALVAKGFDVVAVTGPTALPFGELRLKQWVPVETNDEMEDAVLAACRKHRPFAAVFSAAVLDFAPAKVGRGKRASLDGDWVLRLKPTRKILDVVRAKFPSLVRIGFKLEWAREDAKESRIVKRYLGAKGLDGLLVNYLSELGPHRHPARLFLADGSSIRCQGKPAVAKAIATRLRRLHDEKKRSGRGPAPRPLALSRGA